MSTRAAIAKPQGDGWIGKYQHSDGYPTWLGATLWKSLHTDFSGDVTAFLAWALDSHPAGWSSYSGPNAAAPKCYCHDDYFVSRDGVHEEWFVEEGGCGPGCSPLSIQWVYVFDAASKTLTILNRKEDTRPQTERSGSSEDGYYHTTVTSTRLDGPEPDWDAVEAKGRAL